MLISLKSSSLSLCVLKILNFSKKQKEFHMLFHLLNYLSCHSIVNLLSLVFYNNEEKIINCFLGGRFKCANSSVSFGMTTQIHAFSF